MTLNHSDIQREVALALQEDIGTGDISAELIDAHCQAKATVITRESAVIAGQPWFNAVFQQLDPNITIKSLIDEGATLSAKQTICLLSGNARALLSGERCALNFLQTLSGTATTVAQYVKQLSGFNTQLLDTRKTLPGLRYAQKYAVRCGGAHNHRMGLFDAFLIKENHIASCGSISKAVALAKKNHVNKLIEVEVENLDEFHEALQVGCDRIMLDNFDLEQVKQAVCINQKRSTLEVSGDINLSNLHQYAALGVDFISVGALTKHLHAIDLSMTIEI